MSTDISDICDNEKFPIVPCEDKIDNENSSFNENSCENGDVKIGDIKTCLRLTVIKYNL